MSTLIATGPISSRNFTVKDTSFTIFGVEGRVRDGRWLLPTADNPAAAIPSDPQPILAEIEAQLARVIEDGYESVIAQVCLSPLDGLRLALEGQLTVAMLQQATGAPDSIGVWMLIVGTPRWVLIRQDPPYEKTPVVLNPNGHIL